MTGALNTLELTHSAELVDDTVFGDSTRSAAAGLETLGLTFSGFLDFSSLAQDEIIRACVGQKDIPMTVAPETGLVGTRAFLLEAGLSAYQLGGAVGVLAPFSLTAFASSGQKIVNGVIIEDGTTPRTASGNGTAVQVGAVGATQKLYAIFHLVAFTGFTSIDVRVESDNASGFPSPITRVTFANLTAPGAQYAAPVAGPITDDWWRAAWTLNGAGPGSATIIVAIGIK